MAISDMRAHGNNFVEITTFHALPSILTRKLIIWKVFWGIIFFAGVAAFMRHIIVQFQMYRKYPHTVDISFVANDQLPFPAVTFCNLSPIKKSTLFCTSHVEKEMLVMDTIGSDEQCKRGTYDKVRVNVKDIISFPTSEWWRCNSTKPQSQDFALCSFGKLFDYWVGSGSGSAGIDQGNYRDNQESGQQVESVENVEESAADSNDFFSRMGDSNSYAGFLEAAGTHDLSDIFSLMLFSKDEIQQIGFSLQDMLVSCSFNEKKCDAKAFEQLHDGRYGNCFIFNSGLNDKVNQSSVRGTRKHGFQHGLKLTLNIQTHEYVGMLTDDMGVRLVVHPADVLPMPERQGFNVGPGRRTSVGLTMREVQRLLAPHQSDCVYTFPDYMNGTVLKNTKYDMELCSAVCVDYNLAKTCECTERVYTSNGTHVSKCDNLNKTQRDCRKTIYQRIAYIKSNPEAIDCGCKVACSEVNYHQTISTSAWPSNAYKQLKAFHHFAHPNDTLAKLLADLKAHESKVFDDPIFDQTYRTYVSAYADKRTTLEHHVKKNLVNVHVYYKKLNFERIIEKPSYPFSSFASDSGGILGLYVGMSLVTFVEILEFILMGGYYLCQKSKGDGKISNIQKKHLAAENTKY